MKNPAGLQVFADRLRTLRKEHKMTQQALADYADVEQSTIARIESVKLVPTLDSLISISRALGIEVYDLLRDSAITTSDKPLNQLPLR